MTSKPRRSNAERAAQTRGTLLAAATELFGRLGYEGTSTIAVLEAAGLTRGALYHHFADKRELFRTVAEQVERTLEAEVESRTAHISDPKKRLRSSVLLYLDEVSRSAPARILLRDAPAVLGAAEWQGLADAAWMRHLGAIADAARPRGKGGLLPLLIGAAIDRAALALAEGRLDPAAVKASVRLLLDRLLD